MFLRNNALANFAIDLLSLVLLQFNELNDDEKEALNSLTKQVLQMTDSVPPPPDTTLLVTSLAGEMSFS